MTLDKLMKAGGHQLINEQSDHWQFHSSFCATLPTTQHNQPDTGPHKVLRGSQDCSMVSSINSSGGQFSRKEFQSSASSSIASNTTLHCFTAAFCLSVVDQDLIADIRWAVTQPMCSHSCQASQILFVTWLQHVIISVEFCCHAQPL